MKRLLVTGSRDWTDKAAVRAAIDSARITLGLDTVLVHGDARGADRMAAELWTSRWMLPTEPHPADWTQHGKRAGYLRNAEMVDLGADLCLAFILPCAKPGCRRPKPHGTHGAEMCADLAEDAGIPVRRFEVTS